MASYDVRSIWNQTVPCQESFFKLLPCKKQTQIEATLALATFSSMLNEDIFPVLRRKETAEPLTVEWITGPRPLLRTTCLSPSLQDALAFDGLHLVSLPPPARGIYQEALQKLPERHLERELDKGELCQFLKTTWAALHSDIFAHLPLEEARSPLVLSDREKVLQLLKFATMPETHAVGKAQCFEHLEGVPLLLTHGGKLTAFGAQNRRSKTDRDLLPKHPDLFIHEAAWRTFTEVKGRVTPIGIRELQVADLLPYQNEVEEHVHAGGPEFRDNPYLKHLWSLVSRAANRTNPFGLLGRWRILAVYANDGARLEPLQDVHQTILISTDAQEKIAHALLCIGFRLLQQEAYHGFLSEQLVCKDDGLIQLLLSAHHLAFEGLDEADIHALLTYFSGIVISEKTQLPEDIRRLPLFKLAQGGFTDLCRTDVTYCCLDPKDKHAGALEKLMPSTAVLLAWPTQQLKPIYEHLRIRLCNGEDFMVHFILPELPQVCQGSACRRLATTYLNELHEFVVTERSQKVAKAARQIAFVPTADNRMSLASSLIDPEIQVVQCFKHCCSEHLPADWIYSHHYRHYRRLLHHLGLQTSIPAEMLLKFAQDLDAKKELELHWNLLIDRI